MFVYPNFYLGRRLPKAFVI